MQTILVALISGLIFAGWIPACMMMDKLKKGRKKRPIVWQRKKAHTKYYIHTGYTKGGVKSSGRYGIQPARR